MKKFGKLFKSNLLHLTTFLVNFGWQLLFAIIGLFYGETFSVLNILEGTLFAHVVVTILFTLGGCEVKNYINIKFPSRKVGK